MRCDDWLGRADETQESLTCSMLQKQWFETGFGFGVPSEGITQVNGEVIVLKGNLLKESGDLKTLSSFTSLLLWVLICSCLELLSFYILLALGTWYLFGRWRPTWPLTLTLTKNAKGSRKNARGLDSDLRWPDRCYARVTSRDPCHKTKPPVQCLARY